MIEQCVSNKKGHFFWPKINSNLYYLDVLCAFNLFALRVRRLLQRFFQRESRSAFAAKCFWFSVVAFCWRVSERVHSVYYTAYRSALG